MFPPPTCPSSIHHLAISSPPSRDTSGRFRSNGEPKARPVQVWLKPDVIQRLDAYCALYGIGRGRAIGHLLKGALPDPSWLPSTATLINESASTPSDAVDSSSPVTISGSQRLDPDLELLSLQQRPCPRARFKTGDVVTNKRGDRKGVIDAAPPCWVAPLRLPSGELQSGYWTYSVAWEGQMGFTISYSEDLLSSQEPDTP